MCYNILKGVAVVVVRRKIGGDEGTGPVLSGDSFGGDINGHIEGVGTI